MKVKSSPRLGTSKLTGSWRDETDPQKRRAAYIKEYLKQKYRKNKNNKSWVKKNREASLIWAKNNPLKARNRHKRWRSVNKEKVNEQRIRYLACKKSLIHPLCDKNEAAKIYKECVTATHKTGILHHVDHIIPLACGGFHHHLNMQILPASVNAKKSDNPIWEMPGFKSWRDVPEYLWPKKLKCKYIKLL